ncbi:carboxylesterase/lipase family protein [Leifsonia sp. Leaf264]|uniref:carboxylesterase/lipase family protein n=1 Tax=Leifsonia sp. Leaf264 TaxID=1736314 RepID=UPI000A74C530|nr:carboxylesterase family protein [Leifsonia sp. Leaf264]
MTDTAVTDTTAQPRADLVEVETTAGRVRGRWRGVAGAAGSSAAFLGIPFAEPPVGELRFAAPVPHRAWTGVRDALEHGPTPQRETLAEITLIPEPSVPGASTLNVNVFTPAPGSGEALPVLVYIHGGGYTAGSPASPWYDGAAFNRDGVVTVSISYRLGFDGFGWISDAPNNRAVLDWLLALEWVQQNIAAFGGDASRVTISGQSAGGAAVLALLGLPAAQGLFSGVYSISGPIADVSLERSEKTGRHLAELAGVEPTRAGWSSVSEEGILDLQKKLAEPPQGGNPMDMMTVFIEEGLPWAPVIDGQLVPHGVLDALALGVGSDKPLVLGATDDEFTMILKEAEGKLRFIPPSLLLGKMGLKGAARREYLAANRSVKGTANKLGRYITDRMFRTAILRVIAARGAAPTWTYRFSWKSPTFGSSVHCVDVPFFFDCLAADRVGAIAGENPPQSLADAVHGGAVAFIRDGDPGWPRFVAGTEVARVFDAGTRDDEHAFDSVKALLPA